MNYRMTPIAHAIALAVAGASFSSHVVAQSASVPSTVIEVTGIRASLEQSINAKKNAETNVEVITAEDIGKMPDKNIADALSRLTGVSVQAGAANAMDEAERVAIRGTSPNLNLFTVNGHAISSGDWHVSDQGSSGRSVGFGLLPSQLIGQAVVHKTGQADIVEGGLAGSIDMSLRRPLDFKKQLTGEVAIGAVYADRPDKIDPQLSGLVAWKNEAKTFGVLLQAFSEERHLRRDGQETFNRGAVTAAQATAAGNAALTGVLYPNQFGAALFQGVREREGGYLGVQFRPSKGTDVNLSVFQSTLTAENTNYNPYVTINTMLNNGYIISNPVVEGGVLRSATLTRGPAAHVNTQAMHLDNFSRNGSESDSSFIDLDLSHKVNDALTLKARLGTTEGKGLTPRQPHIQLGLFNPQTFSYKLNADSAANYSFTNASGNPIDLGNIANYRQVSDPAHRQGSIDTEDYLHLDGEYALKSGFLTNVKFGARVAKHHREFELILSRWNAQDDGSVGFALTPTSGDNLLTLPGSPALPVPGGAYPSDFGQGLGGIYPISYPTFSAAQLQAYADQYQNNNPLNKNWTSGYTVDEKNSALYGLVEFEHGNWSGNAGARMVRTEVSSLSYARIGAKGCEATVAACKLPGVITGYIAGTYLPQLTETRHDKLLPSLNIRWQIQPDLIGRFSASRTLGRPNYNELAGAVSLNNSTGQGTSGNPLLSPVTSDNLDVSLGWYFMPRAYLYGALFKQDMKDFVGGGRANLPFIDTNTGLIRIYDVATRAPVDAKLHGAELAVEMPIGAGFGVGANYTYVDSEDASTVPAIQMISTSKHTSNLIGFYENDRYSFRMAWNQRSAYPYVKSGTIIRWFDDIGTLSASFNYKISEQLSVSIDGNNLNNPLRLGYHETANLPANWYKAGRQYYMNLRMKF